MQYTWRIMLSIWGAVWCSTIGGSCCLFEELSDAVHLEDHVVYLRSCLMQYTWRIIGALEITLMRFLDSKIERTSVCRRLQSPSLSPCNNGINQTCNDKNNNREVAKKKLFWLWSDHYGHNFLPHPQRSLIFFCKGLLMNPPEIPLKIPVLWLPFTYQCFSWCI